MKYLNFLLALQLAYFLSVAWAQPQDDGGDDSPFGDEWAPDDGPIKTTPPVGNGQPGGVPNAVAPPPGANFPPASPESPPDDSHSMVDSPRPGIQSGSALPLHLTGEKKQILPSKSLKEKIDEASEWESPEPPSGH
jgi:hypothetical protein